LELLSNLGVEVMFVIIVPSLNISFNWHYIKFDKRCPFIVSKCKSIIVSHFIILLMIWLGTWMIHILTTNKIKYVLYDGIKILYEKSPNVVELMLESWIFFIKEVALIRIIKLILLITKLDSKDLKIYIGDVGVKKRCYLIFNRVLALQMKVYHSKNVKVVMHSFLVYTWT